MIGKKFLFRLVIFLVIVFLGWAGYASYKQVERNRRIETEIAALAQEADKIKNENETLSDRISYFSSREFKEQEAREKLGLKKPEETMVVLKDGPEDAASSTAAPAPRAASRAVSNQPNYQKWWNLFMRKS